MQKQRSKLSTATPLPSLCTDKMYTQVRRMQMQEKDNAAATENAVAVRPLSTLPYHVQWFFQDELYERV